MQSISLRTINIAMVALVLVAMVIEYNRTADLVVAVQSDCPRPVSYDKSGDVICPQ